eukprot:TRINITY_DN277_c0_g1_i2.p1 TRINITY_DN277_c0_g1~~TRINITY_DN277_c0_g1_i2.p1  ORF type:complete len:402 (-),score=79.01 TRINITY_DN277_c0_g1_i2:244-1449(-)
MKRLIEPERAVQFRVAWTDDKGVEQVNRGFRVQFNQAIGPYKGGLRFHPSVNLSIIKFLGFEQVFKNSLTTLPLGGGKGGSDFDPKGKSDREVMAFCQAFMTELSRHIGPDRDVPAGDVGVGGREIGYLFGQYKRLTAQFSGVLTGKSPGWGGSLIRPEATGYGVVYFAQNILEAKGQSMEGVKVLVSGSGNVAQYALEKLLDVGAIPLTASDSSGYVYEPEGFTREKLAVLMDIKNNQRGRISQYAKQFSSAKYVEGKKPWAEASEGYLVLPCATQNEISTDDAKALVNAKVAGVVEGANMPTTNDGVRAILDAGLVYGPAKAANAGGVAVSGLEMTQNSTRLPWTREEVDNKLKDIMKSIYDNSEKWAKELGKEGNLQAGANAAGFVKVADAMLAQGTF